MFADDAFRTLAERSGGVPRRVNTLATQALFVGAMRGLSAIDAELMSDVADDQE
jgi:type II secretory pathway predicted ATPase ExeA